MCGCRSELSVFTPHSVRVFISKTSFHLTCVVFSSVQRGDDGSSFSEGQLSMYALDLHFAGTDTTSNTLLTGFLYLMGHPHIQGTPAREKVHVGCQLSECHLSSSSSSAVSSHPAPAFCSILTRFNRNCHDLLLCYGNKVLHHYILLPLPLLYLTERCQQEIDTVLEGKEKATFNDRHNMPYMQVYHQSDSTFNSCVHICPSGLFLRALHTIC